MVVPCMWASGGEGGAAGKGSGFTAPPVAAMIALAHMAAKWSSVGRDCAKRRKFKEARLTGIVRLLICAAALAFAAVASAQTYPERNVRVLVPFAQGGPTDVIARVFAQKLSENLGHTFYVENVPGAGGNLGTAQAARAAGDGYTILVTSTGFMVNPSLYAKVPYDPVKDFTPLTLAAVSPNVIFVHPSLPAKTFKELIDLVKANPG